MPIVGAVLALLAATLPAAAQSSDPAPAAHGDAAFRLAAAAARKGASKPPGVRSSSGRSICSAAAISRRRSDRGALTRATAPRAMRQHEAAVREAEMDGDDFALRIPPRRIHST